MRLRVPASLQSSNRITLSEISEADPRTEKCWGGVFWHPVFVSSARDLLGLRGVASKIDLGGETIGAANLLYRELAGVRSASIPLLFQYYGPLLFENETGRARWQMFERELATQSDFAYLSLPPKSTRREWVSPAWRVICARTIVVDADGLKRWGSRFRDDVRNKINKAKRERVVVSTAELLPQDIWRAPFLRRRISSPIEPEMLARWCRVLIENSLLKIYVASIDSMIVAFRGELIYGEYAYDWIAASEPAFHPTGVNQMLMGEIGADLSKSSVRTWDLIGGEIQAIADFKKSFGAIEMEHLRLYRSFNLRGLLFKVIRNFRHGNQ